MASFAEFIAESLYSSVNLNWSLSGPKRATGSFSVESIAIEVPALYQPFTVLRVGPSTRVER